MSLKEIDNHVRPLMRLFVQKRVTSPLNITHAILNSFTPLLNNDLYISTMNNSILTMLPYRERSSLTVIHLAYIINDIYDNMHDLIRFYKDVSCKTEEDKKLLIAYTILYNLLNDKTLSIMYKRYLCTMIIHIIDVLRYLDNLRGRRFIDRLKNLLCNANNDYDHLKTILKM